MRAASPENEARLLEFSLEATGAKLECLCRGYRTAQVVDEATAPEERSVRRRYLPGGMVKLELVHSPDYADMIRRVLDRTREVHAEPEPPAPEAAASPEDASSETLRRAACDCGLAAVGADGEALSIGRRTRTIPPAIRRWLHGGDTSVENFALLCTSTTAWYMKAARRSPAVPTGS